ncbi:MAG: ankyrin repeat domain-containing protein [Planctomycetes bacterium]|nr:ankyrin repeat domain-containing protein [Planctomycetota bacterium]
MTASRISPLDSPSLLKLFQAIANSDREFVETLLATEPELVSAPIPVGASAQNAEQFFLTPIRHYIYAHDTALHIAAAAFEALLVKRLLKRGALVTARNRLGDMPLHYACDTNHESPARQAKTIHALVAGGADLNGTNKHQVTPLHRAVRTRSVAAVRALLKLGANVHCRNDSGSTPLHLAVQGTGRGGTGTPQSLQQQSQIVQSLLQYGASPSATDDKGRSVRQAARDAVSRQLLESLLAQPGQPFSAN